MRADRATLVTLFEGAPRFTGRMAAIEAEGWDELFDAAEWSALTMPEDEQIELLNAHPRIGAAPGSVSAVSFREQGYDRGPSTVALQQRLDELNDAYEQRFGFRFVVFVDGRSRAEIADVLEARLATQAEPGAEKARALRDVIAIARSRRKQLQKA